MGQVKPKYYVGDTFKVIDKYSSCFGLTCVITSVEDDTLWGNWSDDGLISSHFIDGDEWKRIKIIARANKEWD